MKYWIVQIIITYFCWVFLHQSGPDKNHQRGGFFIMDKKKSYMSDERQASSSFDLEYFIIAIVVPLARARDRDRSIILR